MRVLFQSRSNLFTVSGGDTTQILKTAEALRVIGCQVDISTELEPDVSSYDIVHIFNILPPQDMYVQMRNAKAQGKKVALSTIYVDYTEYERISREGPIGLLANAISPSQLGYLKVLGRAFKERIFTKSTLNLVLQGYHRLQSTLIEMADVCLPNSESEWSRVKSDFPSTRGQPFVVVPNGVDTRLFDSDEVVVSDDVKRFEGCVLCVGRIEGRKNQLNLVRALNRQPWPVVFIGDSAPNHRRYFDRVKSEAGSNIHFISHISHELLPQFYKVARVHCLVSWWETTGLVSLEAAMMGANIVITEKGDTRDYFGDFAFYCEPGDVESIRKAVVEAYSTPTTAGLRGHISEHFTWERAARKSLQGYKLALSGRLSN